MLLGGLRDELAEIDSSIAYHLARITELENRRTAVQVQLGRYIYPVLTLPPEITSEIFVQCLPHGNVSPHPSEAPLLLLVICRAWRDLAISTPVLWTRLEMSLNEDSAHPGLRSPEICEELIQTWFQRARSLPLSLSLSGERGYPQLESRLTTILPRHASHLRRLRLHLHTESFIALRNELPFPFLRRLDLRCFYDFISDKQPLETFRVAPQLRTLSLVNVQPSLISIPWEQLTTAEFHGVGVAECLTVLRNAPCLRIFNFAFSGTDDEEDNHVPVVHPGLLSLTLRQLGAAGYIIPFLALPMLGHLSMRVITDPGNTIIPLPLLSSKSLRSFTFGDSTPMVSLQWIHYMEHLTTLELGSPEWRHRDGLFHALNRAHEPQFLPNLQHLALSKWDSEDLDHDLLDALQSRRMPAQEGLTMLQSFRILRRTVWSSYLDDDYTDVPELQDLVEGGLEFYIGNELDRTEF
ncbi:hypothetical protein C8J57DRAFT_1465956 [Mycena rebaudengoi]|nr:hypothetical protein C8J57DRAFT_1465956 [Mycena rebaudengoi]